FPIIFHNLACPLTVFAEKYGYTKYIPYLCNFDYVMFEAFFVPFYREKICAYGDGYCDFKIKPKASIVPSWPCHSLDENDPLN
ncbi:MAG: L-2-amino-thiazoline-4-carboxylic acid hydrolase, partial [Clostridia bacterium]